MSRSEAAFLFACQASGQKSRGSRVCNKEAKESFLTIKYCPDAFITVSLFRGLSGVLETEVLSRIARSAMRLERWFLDFPNRMPPNKGVWWMP
tara:strand:- start:6471 stop:6749 length:279 start_codon:yes stop_codon:yes gene_type:complete